LQRDLEERAVAAAAAREGRSIEVAIAALDQTGIGDAGEGIRELDRKSTGRSG
jgi:hypothetical protein